MTPTQEQGRQDVTLEVEGVKFYCQRNELSKQSPYFEAMFSDNFVEKHKDVIEIKGIDAVAMKFILQWLKDSSQIELLQGEDVLVVLQAAAMLQFEHLQQACEDAMVQRWMVAESCLQTASTADQLSLTKLYLRANAFALWHFPEVRHTQAFLDLSLTGLVEYLSNNALCLGSNESEFQVFEAVSCWLEHSILDRGEDTVKALSCVRMNFVSVHDIKNMLNYSCIDDSLDAQLLLNCVICLKEGKDVLPLGQSGVLTQESYSSGSEEAKGCCGTLKRIADHLKSRSCDTSPRDSSFDGSSSVMINEKNDDSIENNLSPSEKRFRYDILVSAHHILSIPKRKLPIVACIIGHNMKVDKNSTQNEENNLVSQEHSKKTRKDRNKNGTPHIFFWDADKSNKLIPLLPLTKIDQGPIEALGYTVISRGQDLFVVGGEYLLGYGNWNKSVWRYNVWSEVWTYETSLTVPRRHHSVVCLDDDMYIIGGCGKFRVILDTMDRYNFATHTWHKCPPLPHGLYSAATCVHNNLIYVILSQVYCFHPSSNTWDTLNVTKPAGASFNTAMPFGNYIYLTGLFSSDLMRFDPLGEKCIKCIGNFQNPAGDACLVGDKIYSFTEEDDKPCIEVFDIESGSFEVLWKGTSSDGKISFKKLGGCFPLVLYERLRYTAKSA